jgi:hypothetical protein
VQVSSPYFQKQRNWFAHFFAILSITLSNASKFVSSWTLYSSYFIILYKNKKLLRVFSKHWFSLHNYSLNLMIWQMLPHAQKFQIICILSRRRSRKKTNYLFWYMFSLIRHSILIRNVSKIVNNNKPNLSVSFHHIKLKSLIQIFEWEIYCFLCHICHFEFIRILMMIQQHTYRIYDGYLSLMAVNHKWIFNDNYVVMTSTNQICSKT